MEPGIIAEYTAFGGGVHVQEHDFRTLSIKCHVPVWPCRVYGGSMGRSAAVQLLNGFNTTYKVVVMPEV